MENVKKKHPISISEVKELLQSQEPDTMDQIQRWTYDYASKFAKFDAETAKNMKNELVKNCGLTEEEAVELINICLLYTSPSPRDQRGSRMPSSA